MVAGGAILAIGAAAAVGLTMQRGARGRRATGTPEQLRGVAPAVVEKRSPPPRLVELGPGRLLVGRPGANLIDGPAYAVDVGHFFIEAYEVSAAQWAEYVQATKQSELPTEPTAGNLPAVGISRAQAMKYCNWRHRGGRLPTEAEWEYAARDGHNDHLYPWSTAATTAADGPAVATRSGQPRVNLGSLRPQLAPVDSYPLGSSAHGVYNLLGNAAEWTLSDSTLYPGSRAAVPSGMAVVRGGSALTPPQNLFATTRQFVPPTRTDPFIGFRCWTGER